MFENFQELVQLSKLALAGNKRDIELYVRRLSRRLKPVQPEIADQLDGLLAERTTREAPLRGAPASAIPVDIDSRQQLVRPEYPALLDCEPIWPDEIGSKLNQIIAERERERELAAAGLQPTKSMLFTGLPGVGKSLAARFIAEKLDRPLVTLDLSAVISSFLGRTGTNVRQVLDYAKAGNCVLFLDEFDAVAKRRDDEAELGELKRLVTVLLQEIDEWPATGILVAATNHPDLLDPAIWRRFDMVIEFPMPTHDQIEQLVTRSLSPKGVDETTIEILAAAFEGHSLSDVERELRRAQREAVISTKPMEDILPSIARHALSMIPLARRKEVALRLRKEKNLTERKAYEWTGVSRDTQRKAVKKIDRRRASSDAS